MQTITQIDLRQLFDKRGTDPDELQNEVVAALLERGLKLATAESCTGGLLSERITRVSGSSAVFDCGVCSYANHIKENVLGVSAQTLGTLGAVSAETAVQMARGVKKLAGADIGISTTGIAGPTGASPGKPVGLVYLGVCTAKREYAVKLLLGGRNGENDRLTIRRLASDAALFTAVQELDFL